MLATRGTDWSTSTVISMVSVLCCISLLHWAWTIGTPAASRALQQCQRRRQGWELDVAASAVKPSHGDPHQQRCITAATDNYVCFPCGKMGINFSWVKLILGFPSFYISNIWCGHISSTSAPIPFFLFLIYSHPIVKRNEIKVSHLIWKFHISKHQLRFSNSYNTCLSLLKVQNYANIMYN